MEIVEVTQRKPPSSSENPHPHKHTFTPICIYAKYTVSAHTLKCAKTINTCTLLALVREINVTVTAIWKSCLRQDLALLHREEECKADHESSADNLTFFTCVFKRAGQEPRGAFGEIVNH